MPLGSISARRQAKAPTNMDASTLEIPAALHVFTRHLRSEERWRLTQRLESGASPAASRATRQQRQQGQRQAEVGPTHAHSQGPQTPSAPPSAASSSASPPPLAVPSTAPAAAAASPAKRPPIDAAASPVIRSTAPLSSQASLLGGVSPRAASPADSPPRREVTAPSQLTSGGGAGGKTPTPPLWGRGGLQQQHAAAKSRPATGGSSRPAARAQRSPPLSHSRGGLSQSARRGSTRRPPATTDSPPRGSGRSGQAPSRPLVKLPPSHPLPLSGGALRQLGALMRTGSVSLPHLVAQPGMQLYVGHLLAPSLQACGVAASPSSAPAFVEGPPPPPDQQAVAQGRRRTLHLCHKLLTQVAPAQATTGGAWDGIVRHAWACAGGEGAFMRFVLRVFAGWATHPGYAAPAVRVFRPPPGHANVVAAAVAMAQCVGGAATLLLAQTPLSRGSLPPPLQQVLRGGAGDGTPQTKDPPHHPPTTHASLPEAISEAYWAERGAAQPLSLSDIRGGGSSDPHEEAPPPPPRSASAAGHAGPDRQGTHRPSSAGARPRSRGGGGGGGGRGETHTVSLAVCDLLRLLPSSLGTVAAEVLHAPPQDTAGSHVEHKSEHFDVSEHAAVLEAMVCSPLAQPALLRWMLSDMDTPLLQGGGGGGHWMCRLLVSSLRGSSSSSGGTKSPPVQHASHLRELVQHIMFRVPEDEGAAFFRAPLGLGRLSLAGGLVGWAAQAAAMGGGGVGGCCAGGGGNAGLGCGVGGGGGWGARGGGRGGWAGGGGGGGGGGTAAADLCDVADAALDCAALLPGPPSGDVSHGRGVSPLEGGVLFAPSDAALGDAYMALREAAAAAVCAHAALHAAVQCVEDAKAAAAAAPHAPPGVTGRRLGSSARPPAGRPPPVKGGSARPRGGTRQVHTAESSGDGKRRAAAAAVEAAAGAVVQATAQAAAALAELRGAAAAADTAGSWSLEPYWLLTLGHLEARVRRMRGAGGVKAALAAAVDADADALAALPLVETLVARGLYPCQATLGLWQACAPLAPVLARWRHALTKWAARRPLLLLWLRCAPSREAARS